MAIRINNKCIKMTLPNGKVVDILSSIIKQMGKFIQIDKNSPESGGYILGYRHHKTGNITLEFVSPPYSSDIQTKVSFKMKDTKHKRYLKKQEKNKSYYMGVWHTHPQINPIPSNLDSERFTSGYG